MYQPTSSKPSAELKTLFWHGIPYLQTSGEVQTRKYNFTVNKTFLKFLYNWRMLHNLQITATIYTSKTKTVRGLIFLRTVVTKRTTRSNIETNSSRPKYICPGFTKFWKITNDADIRGASGQMRFDQINRWSKPLTDNLSWFSEQTANISYMALNWYICKGACSVRQKVGF